MYLITQKALEAKEDGRGCYIESVADYYTYIGQRLTHFRSLIRSVGGEEGNGRMIEDAIASVAGEHPDSSLHQFDRGIKDEYCGRGWNACLEHALDVALHQIDTYHHMYVCDWRRPLGITNDFWDLPMATVENFTQAMILLQRESGFARCVDRSLRNLRIEATEDEDVDEIRDRMMASLDEEMERSRRRWEAEAEQRMKEREERLRDDPDDPLPF